MTGMAAPPPAEEEERGSAVNRASMEVQGLLAEDSQISSIKHDDNVADQLEPLIVAGKEIFEQLDADCSGTLTRAELCAGLKEDNDAVRCQHRTAPLRHRPHQRLTAPGLPGRPGCSRGCTRRAMRRPTTS